MQHETQSESRGWRRVGWPTCEGQQPVIFIRATHRFTKQLTGEVLRKPHPSFKMILGGEIWRWIHRWNGGRDPWWTGHPSQWVAYGKEQTWSWSESGDLAHSCCIGFWWEREVPLPHHPYPIPMKSPHWAWRSERVTMATCGNYDKHIVGGRQ